LKSASYLFLWLAAIGFAASLAAHLLALAGKAMPGAYMVWGLHLGIFVVWLPAVLVANGVTRANGGKFSWKLVLAGCPLWMVRTLYVVFAYAALNFMWLLIAANSPPDPAHTAFRVNVVRGYSGNCMMFYGAAFAILYASCARGGSAAPGK
jgi:hypothetical protein